MRTHWVMALVVMSACTTQGVDRARRWPAHRKEGDERFAQLERRSSELEQKNVALEDRVQKLEDWIARVKIRQPAEAPPSDAPRAAP